MLWIPSIRRTCGVSSAIESAMKIYIEWQVQYQEVTVRVKKNVLNWLGHAKRMNDERMTKNMYDRKVSSKRSKEPWLTFENTVSKIL